MAMQYRLALFNPLTYDEIVKPLQLLTELLHLYEDAYTELQTLADVLSLRAVLDPDSAWAKTYQLYSNSLRQQAENLLRSGLTPSSRALVNAARANYARDIAPIHVAINRQMELAKELAKLNPALRMQYQNMPTIDLLIMDPTRTPQGYSGADIEKSAMLSANAASARNVINLFVKANPGFMEHIKLSGYNTKTIEDMLKIPELAGIVNLVKGLFGYSLDESLSSALKSRLDAEVLSGLFKGVAYKDDSSFLQDPIYMANLHAALTDRNNQREFARLLALALDNELVQRMKMYNINPTSLYSSSELSRQETEESKQLGRYSRYFTNGKINKTGMEALRVALSNQEFLQAKPKETRGYWEMHDMSDRGFLQWAMQNGISAKDIKNKSFGALNTIYNTATLEASRVPNIDVYRLPIKDKATREYLADLISAVLGDEGKIYQTGKLTTIDNMDKISKNRGINAEEFLRRVEKTPILHVVNSPTTDLLLIELTDGTKFILPAGVLDNISAANIADANMRIRNASAANNMAETALYLSNANSYLGSLLNYTGGTEIKPSDGTITF